MNCNWTNASKADERGWRNMQCVRCGKVSAPTPHVSIVRECPASPHWHELGEWIELSLAAAGLSQRRYNWLRRKLGLVKPCGCGERKEALNTWGERLARLIRRG